MLITLFIPCFVDLISPQAGISIVNILEGLGHEIDYPDELGCCGQPPFNAGYWDEAREAARPVLKRLRDSEAVVIASGSCGAMLKVFYKELFHGQPEEAEATTEVVSQARRWGEHRHHLACSLPVARPASRIGL